MALSLDDKLLGEKVHNYCSSSEDEEDPASNSSGENKPAKFVEKSNLPKDEKFGTMPGYSLNTGPKGVMQDWIKYKELETLRKAEEEAEVRNLYKNLSLTCKTDMEIRQMQQEEDDFKELFESVDGLEELFDEYREKRMNEMRQIYLNLPTFDTVFELDALSFVAAIDKEHRQINVIIHLYEPNITACNAINGGFICLAQQYPYVKFCKMRASHANMSRKFLDEALPAFIIYRGGELIGNLIQIDRFLGEDFYASELEAFLLQYGFIPDKTTDVKCKLSTIRNLELSRSADYDID